MVYTRQMLRLASKSLNRERPRVIGTSVHAAPVPPRLVARDDALDGPQDLVDRPIRRRVRRRGAPRGPPDVLARRAAPRPHDDVRRGRAYCTVADTIGQICQNVPGCEPDPDHDPFKYRERLGPASPPQTLPQPLPAPLNRRNLRFGYKEDVFCPEGCKPKED